MTTRMETMATRINHKCIDHPEGMKGSCKINGCKTPGFCRGVCGCHACDGFYVDGMKYEKP
jgi:hypothetical protein